MGKRGLVILHVDGLGYRYMLEALEQGRMPFVKHLIDEEGYEVMRYRSGIPSTTPFAQAGILYGDNSEIPSFRWWDKQSGIPVSFGGVSSFKHVAHKYFSGCDPLVRNGAAIATCYPSAAAATYRLAYREHGSLNPPPFSQRRALKNWALNPLHLADWMWRGLLQIWKANVQYWRTRLSGRPAAKMYVVSDMLEEILLHQLTRFATVEAMEEGYPAIYAAFYAYDETAHAFGPEADYSFRILRHIDNTIRRIAAKRHSPGPEGCEYELVILSDHGQVETVPFEKQYGRRLGEIVSEWLPTYAVEELKGKKTTPKEAIDGHILLAYSGGLAHWYFTDISWRLQYDELEERYPGLVDRVAGTPGIGFVLLRNGEENHILTKDTHLRFNGNGKPMRAAREFLARFDDPEVLARQLDRLNSFQRSGDMIIFGEYLNGHQINFENQIGGHGSVGGEQVFPFILAKRSWGFKTGDVIGSYQLYPLLKRLRDKLVNEK